jgi:hypothetical protein
VKDCGFSRTTSVNLDKAEAKERFPSAHAKTAGKLRTLPE